MTVRIDEETRGRFGNKIFHYNTLIQISSILNKEASCVHWAGSHYFNKNSIKYVPILENQTSIKINGNDLSKISVAQLKEYSRNYDHIVIDTLALHGTFFKFYNVDIRNFLSLKPKFNKALPDNVTGIHIRGDDIRGLDGNDFKEVHSSKFYIDAIEYLLSKNKSFKFFIATDDNSENYKTFFETYTYLKRNNLLFKIETNSNKNEYICWSR